MFWAAWLSREALWSTFSIWVLVIGRSLERKVRHSASYEVLAQGKACCLGRSHFGMSLQFVAVEVDILRGEHYLEVR